MMFDAHVHLGTGAGDSGATPAEAVAHARAAGYRTIALLVRCDLVSLPLLLPPLVASCRAASLYGAGEALPGVELAHVPPPLLAEAVSMARSLGAALVAAHGECFGNETPLGTTLAAIEAQADLVLHPGLLTPEEASLAAARHVALELSLYPPHGLYNGHVARLALAHDAPLLTGSNARVSCEYVPLPRRRAILRGAGLSEIEADAVDAQCLKTVTRMMSHLR